jgi:hypothetical protein
MIEWNIDVEFVKRVEFAAVPNGNGANGSDVEVYFRERYYEKYDTFKIDGSRQQCIVKATPVRKADNFWAYTVQVIDADFSSELDLSACQPGMTTRFLSNIMPEYHETGYTKYQSNVEKIRNYMTTIRVDDSYSSKYALMEDTFIKVGKGENQGCLTEKIYKLEPMKKNLIENFLYARENMILLAKGNIGVL